MIESVGIPCIDQKLKEKIIDKYKTESGQMIEYHKALTTLYTTCKLTGEPILLRAK